jgi:hypothetical protein
MSFYQHLTPDYQEKVLKRWTPILDAGAREIKSDYAKLATALVLENTQREFEAKSRLVTESFDGSGVGYAQTGAFGASPTGVNGGGAFGAYTPGTYGGADARMPQIVIPTVRRIFPELLAHDLVGVQPLQGPVGFAFALRARYGANGKGGQMSEGTEIGFNYIDSSFTGASGNAPTVTGEAASAWQAYAGTTAQTGGYGQKVWENQGQGAQLSGSEWWNIGEDMPMAKITLEKSIVEAKSRKLASHWSLELGEDMMNMHGVDVDTEMVNIMSYEIQAEIDRHLLTEIVKSAVAGSAYSSWSPVSADGRNQFERIGTLYTHILDKANTIAITTRRGPASYVVCSPKVCALLERMQDFQLDTMGNVKVQSGTVGVAKVGTLRSGGITVYRDTFAMGNYALLGYKGPNPYDTGIIFCPYIPVQLMRAVGADNFSPRIGVRTRYGILNHLFGSENYYQFINVKDIVGTELAADGSRIFLQ